jgi:hypothetical protein
VVGTAELVSTTFQELSREVQPGNRILLSDGKLSLKVLEVKGEDVICEVVDGGILEEHQGINLPGARLSVPSLTEKDHEDLKFGLDHGVDGVAVSFVRNASDLRAAKAAIASRGADTVVCAKLTQSAISRISSRFSIACGFSSCIIDSSICVAVITGLRYSDARAITGCPANSKLGYRGAELHTSYAGGYATRVLAENPPDSDAKIGMVDRVEMQISFAGNLSEEQQRRLLDIATRCPVHRMLVSQVQIHTKLLVPT